MLFQIETVSLNCDSTTNKGVCKGIKCSGQAYQKLFSESTNTDETWLSEQQALSQMKLLSTYENILKYKQPNLPKFCKH